MNFDSVEKIAAAILYEGYILYPYRKTSIKNLQRWNFGTLYPRIYAEAQRPAEPFRFITECLAIPDATATLDVKINFLQLVRQGPLAPDSDNSCKLSDPSLEWEEAVERSSEHHDLRLSDLISSPLKLNLEIEATGLPEGLQVMGWLLACKQLLRSRLSSKDGACRLHLELENASTLLNGAEAKREEALPKSFVSAHMLLGITGGEFISLLDPVEVYRESTTSCCNVGVFPVLAGTEPDRTMMLCSPIILYDYPKVAPESEGDFFDGTEMDEMLTLRVLTLTDAEKQEMRDGDPSARRILERTESLTAESLLKAHGVIRGMREIRGDTL